MTFSDIVDNVNAAATTVGLPALFGDTATQNVYSNQMAGMYFTFDVSSAFNPLSGVSVLQPSYTVTVRCLDTSYYLRDAALEIDCLIRTDLALQRFVTIFACRLNVTRVNIVKVQNEYNSIKSGWQATFEIASETL